MPLRVVFFGTPAFAVPTLDALVASRHVLAGVVTQPDKPRGRGQKVSASPVKAASLPTGVPILQPDRLKAPEFLEAFDALGADLGVVAAYGRILPQVLLDRPRLGLINVHASLLPRWRGAAPVHRAILAGDAETGVTIMRVVLALDAGPMLARTRLPIGPDETSASLEARLATAGAALLVEVVDALAAGPVTEEPQDEKLATYAHRIERADSQVDWSRPAQAIHNQIRGLQPWPLAAVVLAGQRVRLIESRIPALPATTAPRPGVVVEVGQDFLAIGTGDRPIHLTRVQPDGRAVMPVRDFLNGRRVAAGDRVDPLPTL